MHTAYPESQIFYLVVLISKKVRIMKLIKATTIIFLSIVIISLLIITSCKKNDNPVTSLEANPTTSAKLDTTINVDISDANISYRDNLVLHIPQGTVSGNTKLTITKLTENSIPADSEMVLPDIYEITLGSQHVFDKPLSLTLKYDPEKLNDGKLKYQIGAAYYDETLSRWELFKGVSIDTINNTISFSTLHLTKLSWWRFKRLLGYTDYLTSPHFIIYWTDGKIPSNTDYKSLLTNHKGTDPYYVQDILYYLEEARAAYKKDNLTVPDDTTDKAEVRLKDLGKGVDGQTSYFGYIQINQNIKKDNYFSQAELVQVTCAHELLHYVQDYYYMLTFEGNIIKWWLEATAVQADRIVWPNKSKFEAISYADGSLGGQLERAWDDCNLDPNYYIAGGFLTYLTTYRNGAKLSIPEIIIETGKASKVSYFRTIINDYLKNKLSSDGIGYEYRDYIKWAYEHKGPIEIDYIPPLSSGNDKYVVPVRLTETNPTWKGTVTVSNLAIKMVKIISPTTTGISNFKIALNKQDSQIEQYVYISDKDKTVYQKYLTVGDTLNITLDQKNQWIDIISSNIFNDESGSFDMSVELVQAPTITSITPSSAAVGTVVQIKGNSFGASQNTGEVWFGTVKALSSDIVSWLDTQIDVKVPVGATTGNVNVVTDGKKSNNVNFTVEGGPTITEIFDELYNRDHQGIHKFTMPNNTAEIAGHSFGDYPSIRKVYVNNVEAEVNEWSDTLVVFKLPEQTTGNINVKLETSNGESNEFPYFCGLPISYLHSLDSLLLKVSFDVKYYNSKGNMNDSYSVGTGQQEFHKSNFNWNDRVLTVNLNSIENINGTISYTFAENGIEIEKVDLDYTRTNSWPNEIIHYTGTNIPFYQTDDWYGHETTFYSFGACGENLEQNTTTISGSINYVDELRADIDGIDYSSGCAFNTIFLELNFTN